MARQWLKAFSLGRFGGRGPHHAAFRISHSLLRSAHTHSARRPALHQLTALSVRHAQGPLWGWIRSRYRKQL